jgi:hypothetical protein
MFSGEMRHFPFEQFARDLHVGPKRRYRVFRRHFSRTPREVRKGAALAEYDSARVTELSEFSAGSF